MPEHLIALLGPFGPPQLACLRSWKRLGLRVALMHSDDTELGPACRRQFDHYHFVGPAETLGRPQLQGIGETLERLGARGLVCVAEALAIKLGNNRSCFPPQLQLLVSPPETLDRLVSKLHQIVTARDCGFNLLPTWKITRDDPAALDSFDYPVVVRPDRPESVFPFFKAELLRTPDEAHRFLAVQEPGSGPIVAQRYIFGPTLVVHGSRSVTGHVEPLVAYRVDIKYQGVSVGLRPVTLSAATDKACRAFVEHENVIGVFHFELMLDDSGNEWFLEINARLGGTTAKVYASGFDEPAHLLACHGLLETLLGRGSSRLKPAISRIAATRCMLSMLRGTASPIDYPYPRKSTLLASVAKAFLAWPDDVLSLRSPSTTLAYLFPSH